MGDNQHFYIVDAILPWSSLEYGGLPLQEGAYGSIGAVYAFDELEKAEAFRDAIAPSAEVQVKVRVDAEEVRRDD